MFKQSDILQANKTSRNSKAVGSKAITPKHVRKFIDLFLNKDAIQILDYGSGSTSAHARAFLNDGYYCTAHEFGDNFNQIYHNPLALEYQYDVVYASNVLNVQADETMARETIKQIAHATQQDGYFFANYPASPRKSTLSTNNMFTLLREYFSIVNHVGGSKAAPLWVCSK